MSADEEELGPPVRLVVPLDSSATTARKFVRLVAALLPTALATLSQEVASALLASQVPTAPAPASPVSTGKVASRSAGVRTMQIATT